jgi:hypothetical protein
MWEPSSHASPPKVPTWATKSREPERHAATKNPFWSCLLLYQSLPRLGLGLAMKEIRKKNKNQPAQDLLRSERREWRRPLLQHTWSKNYGQWDVHQHHRNDTPENFKCNTKSLHSTETLVQAQKTLVQAQKTLVQARKTLVQVQWSCWGGGGGGGVFYPFKKRSGHGGWAKFLWNRTLGARPQQP